jgi:pyruvate kinase
MMSETQRRTTLIWSVEAGALDQSLTTMLKEQGADALRIVPEKGLAKKAAEFIQQLQQKKDKFFRRLPVLVDIDSYPRGIISGLKSAKTLKFGDNVSFSQVGGGGDFEVATDEWSTLFASDHSVYVGYGNVVLKPVKVADKKVQLQVVQGGDIRPEAEIHVPFTRQTVTLESISSEALELAAHPGVDCVILPSIDDPEELEKVAKKLSTEENCPWLILKVGTLKVYENIERLLPFVRGVLVSRIELAMEMDPAQIPMVTKQVIQVCNAHAKLSLVSSEMLGSMRFNATPTRAEVSDIANAVFDGADGVVLSEALAHGRYLQRGAMLATRTIEDAEDTAEQYPLNWTKDLPPVRNEIEAVTYAAYRSAHRNRAKAIVCITKIGNTALHLASFGAKIPVIALSTSEHVVRRLRLVKGVEGVYLDELPNIDSVLPLIDNLLGSFSWFEDGDKYVFVSVSLSSVGKEGSNLFTIQTLGAS